MVGQEFRFLVDIYFVGLSATLHELSCPKMNSEIESNHDFGADNCLGQCSENMGGWEKQLSRAEPPILRAQTSCNAARRMPSFAKLVQAQRECDKGWLALSRPPLIHFRAFDGNWCWHQHQIAWRTHAHAVAHRAYAQIYLALKSGNNCPCQSAVYPTGYVLLAHKMYIRRQVEHGCHRHFVRGTPKQLRLS